MTPSAGILRAVAHGALALALLPSTASTAQNVRPNDLLKNAPPETKGFFRESLPEDFNDRAGFVPLFDGHSLSGWDGNPKVWKVVDGKIVGERPPGSAHNNDYLVRRGIVAKDFDLKVEIRVLTGGSGIQYRSRTGEPWTGALANTPKPNPRSMMTGPQADLWAAAPPSTPPFEGIPIGAVFNGQVYIENSPERIVSWRGEVTESVGSGPQRRIGTIGDFVGMGGYVSAGWNQYRIVARGGVVMHILNGQLMAIHINDDPLSPQNQAGLFGIEAELNPARVEVRSIWLKKLD